MSVIGTADLFAIAEQQTADGAGLVEEHEVGVLVPWPHTVVSLDHIRKELEAEVERLWGAMGIIHNHAVQAQRAALVARQHVAEALEEALTDLDRDTIISALEAALVALGEPDGKAGASQ